MSNKNGFTLVELLAVIGIVGILTLTVSSAVISILNNQKEALAKDTEKRLCPRKENLFNKVSNWV